MNSYIKLQKRLDTSIAARGSKRQTPSSRDRHHPRTSRVQTKMATASEGHFILRAPADFDAFEAEVTIALEEEQVLGWVKDVEYIKSPPWRAPPLTGGKMMGNDQDEARAVKWQAQDAKARRIILDHLDAQYRNDFRSFRTARSLWRALEARLRINDAKHLATALGTWTSIAIGSNELLDSYIKRFESAMKTLETALAQERLPPLDHHLHALQFLQGLRSNDWYPKFVAVQLQKKPQDLNFEALRYDAYNPEWFEGLTSSDDATGSSMHADTTKPSDDPTAGGAEPGGPRQLDFDHPDSDCFVHPEQGHRNSQCNDQDATRKRLPKPYNNKLRYQDPGLLGKYESAGTFSRPHRQAGKGSAGRDHRGGGSSSVVNGSGHSAWFRKDLHHTGASSVISASGSSSEQTEQGTSPQDIKGGRHSRANSRASTSTDLIDVGDNQSISDKGSENK